MEDGAVMGEKKWRVFGKGDEGEMFVLEKCLRPCLDRIYIFTLARICGH